MRRFFVSCIVPLLSLAEISAETVEAIKYGDFEQWVTRNIKESRILGGNTKQVYEIAPNGTINGSEPYRKRGGSPWETSNVMANVMGIIKTSNAVFPDERSAGNRCCKLSTILEKCKALGMVNIEVLVTGTVFLGEMLEPIRSTSNPYSKMEMGVPFSRRPKALRIDYRLVIPDTDERLYSSGFGSKKTYKGHDTAEVFILLQRRWEDEDGNLYAKRVGTGRERFGTSTGGWVNNHDITVMYGDITQNPGYKPFMGLIPEEKNYYARNSKGKMVPVKEVGWDDADATPTHLLVMASSGSGTAYIGTLGLTFWIDNMKLVYE